MVSIKRLTDSVRIGDLRVRPNPHAVVDHAAQVFDEVGVDLRRDGGDWLAGNDVDVRVDAGGWLREETRAGEGEYRGG
jgi:hypothetical protein